MRVATPMAGSSRGSVTLRQLQPWGAAMRLSRSAGALAFLDGAEASRRRQADGRQWARIMAICRPRRGGKGLKRVTVGES